MKNELKGMKTEIASLKESLNSNKEANRNDIKSTSLKKYEKANEKAIV